jgi:hypothetical protein
MTQHVLDRWLAGLPRISRADVSAFEIEKWPAAWDDDGLNFDGLSEDELTLALLVGRPTADEKAEQEDLCSSFEKWSSSKLAIWNSSTTDLLVGSSVALAPRSTLFEVDFLLNSVISSSGASWTVVSLTDEMSVFYAWVEDITTSGWPCWQPGEAIGVVPNESMYCSIALLLQRFNPADVNDIGIVCPQGFGLAQEQPEQSDIWDEVTPRGIESVELYRLALACEGLGGDALLTLGADELMRYRATGATRGYAEFVELFGLE